MIGFFKKTKPQTEQASDITEVNDSSANNEQVQATQYKPPVHGEEGVCCGGCGGQ
jgi:CCGSCS motif protein